jgi:hypothetical protein
MPSLYLAGTMLGPSELRDEAEARRLERDEFRLGIACLCEVISAFG